MGILSDLFSFFSDLFSKLFTFIKENWLVILLLVAAVLLMNPALAAAIWTWISATAVAIGGWIAGIASTFFAWLGQFSMLELLLGAAAIWVISDPEGAIEFVGDVIEEVTTSVGDALSSVFGSPALLLALGAGLFFLMKDDKKEDTGEQY